MKIDSSNSTSAILRPATVRATNDAESQATAGAVEKVSAGNASSSTVSLSMLHASDSADIDTAKVESIKAALRDGSYSIDSGKIADAMLSNARDLLQTRVA